MFGLRPMWFHATNVLLHAAACVLFTRVCLIVAKLRRNFAIIAGVLFAVHPIHTEAVTGIVGRADVLACIFCLVSLLVYHGNTDEPDGTAVLLSIVLGGLSMLAKETGVTVFILNLAYDTYRCWPSLRRAIIDLRWTEETHQFGRRISRVLLSMGVLLAVRLALLQGSLPRFSQQDNPTAFHPNLYVRLLTFCYLAAFNWWLCLCPSTLSHDWQMGSIPLLTSISDPRNLVTFVAFGAVAILAYRSVIDFEQQRHMPLVLGFLLLTLPFLPATNLVVTVGFVVAERVLYIPSVGCVLLVVYGAQILWETMKKYRGLLTIMGIVLVASGTCKTINRNLDWYSRETLLKAGLSVLPHNAKMHYNFGNFLRDSSKLDTAVRHYKQALRLWPTYASAHNNLGTLMSGKDMAEHHFREAIKYSVDHVNAHYNLGQLYRKSNRSSDAVRMLERCISLEPNFIPAYLELAKLRSGLSVGQLFKKVSRLTPLDPEHLTRYGNWLLDNHMLTDALQEYQKALRTDETYKLALVGTCRTLRKLGQHSRLHQIILRWQLMIRIANGGSPKQPDIYLRDWSIKHELRNRAMIYDTTNGISLNGYKSSSPTSTTTYEQNNSKNDEDGEESNDVELRIIRGPNNCNRSDHLHPLIRCPKTHKQLPPYTASTPPRSPISKSTTSSSSSSSSSSTSTDCNENTISDSTKQHCRGRRWTKTRHKHKGPPNIEPNDSVAPLLMSNILDKL